MVEEANVTTVETEASDSTVLTDDATTNSESDGNSSGDGNPDSGQGDAGNEGDQTSPDTYADFNFPEGTQLNEAALAEANPLFKELGLTQDQAQKVVDLYTNQIQAGSQKQVDSFKQLKTDWINQSENDSEFGGDKYEENVKIAQSAVAKYGTPGLKQLLNDHGVGNHPELVRFMVRVGQTLKEDIPGATGAVTSKAQDRVSILYPKS